MSKFLLIRLVLILAAASTVGCHVAPEQSAAYPTEMAKIKFPMDNIRADGLRGPPGGLVTVSYEFCVPANDQVYQEIRRIDQSISIYANAPGRIACAANESLVIGETGQQHWREVLKTLSSLNYIDEIRECFFE